jgi:hypothetical protein
MSVTTGKEDNMHRKLFEREQEIKFLKGEVQSLKEQVDSQTTLA